MPKLNNSIYSKKKVGKKSSIEVCAIVNAFITAP